MNFLRQTSLFTNVYFLLIRLSDHSSTKPLELRPYSCLVEEPLTINVYPVETLVSEIDISPDEGGRPS